MNLFRCTHILLFIGLICTCSLYANDNLDKGIQLLNEKKYKEAKEFFEEKVKKDENNADVHYYLGRTFLLIGDHNKAIDCLEKAIEINDQVADYHFRLGQALGLKTQKSSIFKQAFLASKVISEFEKTIELDSTHVGGHAGAGNFYLQAPSIMGGDVDKAKREAEILLKLSEKQGRLLLIQIYEKEKKLDLAEIEYQIFADSFDDSTDQYQFYNSYGYFLLNRNKNEKAIEMFQKQVQLAPDDANTHDSLGDGFRAAGKLIEALSAYEKALQIDPSFKPSQKKYKELKKQLQKN